MVLGFGVEATVPGLPEGLGVRGLAQCMKASGLQENGGEGIALSLRNNCNGLRLSSARPLQRL